MSHLKGKTILVTGAGGFIGSHLAETLAHQGARVRAMTHYNALNRHGWLDESPAAPDIEFMPGDITDSDSVNRAVQGCDMVFHLAALIAIPYSYQAPRSYIRTNIEGTVNVLQAVREHAVARVIQTSTSEVYGTARMVPISETHPLQGQSPYSASKIGADKMAEAFHASFQVPVTIVRPFNTFGPRQSARAVIPTIITQCLKGPTIRLGNLLPTRDMNFVTNTVDGFIRAALTDAAIGKTVHFGSGREISIGDLAVLIAGILGKKVEIVGETQRLRPESSEVERLLADNSYAKELLDWTPGVTLEKGLEQTCLWFEKNLHRYRADGYVV
jgi:NAD dependent epimerase/dehydratase